MMFLGGLPRAVDELLKPGRLILEVLHLCNRPQRPLRDRRLVEHVGEGQDLLLDLGREAEQTHDLGHPGAGNALPAGDVGLFSALLCSSHVSHLCPKSWEGSQIG